ncbi:MAG: signal peptidase II [Planctomycetota bacterium]
MPERSPSKGVFWATAAVALAADQATKWAIFVILDRTASPEITIIPGFFYLKAAANTGVVWGLFSAWPAVVAAVSVVAAGVVVLFFHRYAGPSRLEALAWGAILGGAFGNLIDRLFYGFVRDFLDFRIAGWSWPTFNIADACITIGAVYLLLTYAFAGSEAEKSAK